MRGRLFPSPAHGLHASRRNAGSLATQLRFATVAPAFRQPENKKAQPKSVGLLSIHINQQSTITATYFAVTPSVAFSVFAVSALAARNFSSSTAIESSLPPLALMVCIICFSNAFISLNNFSERASASRVTSPLEHYNIGSLKMGNHVSGCLLMDGSGSLKFKMARAVACRQIVVRYSRSTQP